MKSITITEALLAVNALEEIYEELPVITKYKVSVIKTILKQSIEIAFTLITGDEQKDQWLSTAKTLPFEPLVLKEIFSKKKKIEPSKFLAIKRICE